MKFPPPHLFATVFVAITSMKSWRRDPESNRTNRICNPVSAVSAYSAGQSNQRLTERIRRLGRSVCVQLAKKTPPLVAGLAIASALTACGGGGSSAPAPAAPATPSTAAPAPVYWVAYGDSTQFAQGDPHAASYPGVHIVNEAVGGTNSKWLLEGTDGKHEPWAKEMARSKRNGVFGIVINHGINDRRMGTPAEYKDRLRLLVDGARAQGFFVMLEEPNPIDVEDIEPFRTAMREVAAHMGVYHCDQPRVPLDPDGVHPNVQGLAIKASRLKSCIADVM